MKLEDQVCSLELSKKLKELGVKQESAFYWMEYLTHNPKSADCYDRIPSVEISVRYPYGSDPRYWDFDKKVSAFTVAELGEMLPVEINWDDRPAYKRYWENGMREIHSVAYFGDNDRNKIQEFDKTEANARAKMLIYLIEQKVIGHEAP